MPNETPFLDDPYIRAALEAKQQSALQRQQQLDQLMLMQQQRDLAIEEQKMVGMASIDKELEQLPEKSRLGKGIQYEAARKKRLIEFESQLAKIDPEQKGAEAKISILTKTYNPEQLAKPFEDTEDHKAAEARKVKIDDDFRVTSILRDQLKIVGNDLAQARMLERQGGEENIKQAAFLKQKAREFALQNVTATLQNATNANAEQLNEVLRRAGSLMTPLEMAGQGQKFTAMVATMMQRALGTKEGSPERQGAISAIVDRVKGSIEADPEAWYRSARTAAQAYADTQNEFLKRDIVDRIGNYHAAKMGVRKMVYKDPLAEVENMMPATVPLMYGGVQSVSTGEMGSTPILSGSAGMAPARQALPTSTSPIKFRYVTSP
jgi:hypothetical protein